LDNGIVCRMKISVFAELLRADSNRAVTVISLLVGRISDLERLTSTPTSYRLRKRLVSLLLMLAERFGQPSADGTRITTTFSHRDIAFMLSSSRASITRELQRLRSEGLITLNGRVLVIPDTDALAYLVE